MITFLVVTEYGSGVEYRGRRQLEISQDCVNKRNSCSLFVLRSWQFGVSWPAEGYHRYYCCSWSTAIHTSAGTGDVVVVPIEVLYIPG